VDCKFNFGGKVSNFSTKGELTDTGQIATIICPFPTPPKLPTNLKPDRLPDLWHVSLAIPAGQHTPTNESYAMKPWSVPVCYEHVASAHDVVSCSQPMALYKDWSHNVVYHGDPPYNCSSTLDQYIVHAHLMGFGVLHIYDLGTAFRAATQRYADLGWVVYVPNWSGPHLHASVGCCPEFEQLAETRCIWENRIRSKWVGILHNVDNFALPAARYATIPEALAAFDLEATGMIHAPMQDGAVDGDNYVYRDTASPWSNVFFRWPLLLKPETRNHVPYCNPRNAIQSNIHEILEKPHFFRGDETVPVRTVQDVEAAEHLTTFHLWVMVMENRRDEGFADPLLVRLGYQLDQALQQFRPAYPGLTLNDSFLNHRTPDRCPPNGGEV